MKKLLIVFLALAFALSAFLTACKKDSNETYVIEVSGSTTVYPLMELLAEKYTELYPGVTLNVNGTGSSDGIKAANTGTSELGMASRNLKSAEKGFGLDELAIAYDGIAPIVHPDNPFKSMSMDEVRRIYTGEISDWKELPGSGKTGPIAVVSREPGSGTRGAFESIVGFQDQLIAGASEFDGNGGVKAAVASNPDAIGYLSMGYLDDTVHGVSIEGAEPTEENVLNGSWPIARPLLVLYRSDSISPATKEFLDWAMGEEGQAIAASKWVPAK